MFTRSRRGSFLVEVIVAAVVMGVALAVLIGMTGRAVTLQSEGERLQIAAMLLDEQLNLVLMRGPDDYDSRFGSEGLCEAPFQAYRYRLEFAGGTGGDAFLVTATISWTEPAGVRSESVSTRIAPRRGEDADPDRRPQEPVERELQ